LLHATALLFKTIHLRTLVILAGAELKPIVQ
jgi:hypothetical protein